MPKHVSDKMKIAKKKFLKRTILLCIDEIDYLFSRDQTEIYNVFNWVHYKNNRMGVITIANTFDFPEKLINRI